MEQLLNPIYGYFMYGCGFIYNLFYLNKAKLINPEDKYYETATIVGKICKEIPGTIQPTNDIMKLKPHSM
jgi:hypothetical protein